MRKTGVTGAGLIAAERLRQIVEGKYTYAHDDAHGYRELVHAAIYYADPIRERKEWWPWDGEPPVTDVDRITDLAKAGALIAAEIDRLLRTERDDDNAD